MTSPGNDMFLTDYYVKKVYIFRWLNMVLHIFFPDLIWFYMLLSLTWYGFAYCFPWKKKIIWSFHSVIISICLKLGWRRILGEGKRASRMKNTLNLISTQDANKIVCWQYKTNNICYIASIKSSELKSKTTIFKSLYQWLLNINF